MGIRDTNGICPRGESVPGTQFPQLYGSIRSFDNLTSLADKAMRDAREVLMMFVRNGSGGALLPGQIVTWKTLLAGRHVTNPAAAATAVAHGVVDHLLPAAGVADGRGFWMTIRGPARLLNDAAGAISEFDRLVVSASVAGCVRVQTAAPTQGNEIPQLNGLAGQAEEAALAGGGALATATTCWSFFNAPFQF